MSHRMRIAPWLSLLASVASLSCRQDKPKEQGAACDLRVQGTRIEYKGHVLPFPGPLASWEQALGAHWRTADSLDVHILDDIGLYALTAPRETEVRGFAIVLNARGDANPLRKTPSYYPRSTFKGRLCVDGSVIAPSSTVADLNRDKEGQPFKRGYLDRIYSYDIVATPTNIYVRIDLTDEGTPESFAMELSGSK